jgi:hypothetical protein
VEKQTAGGAALHLQKQNGGQRKRFFAMRQCSTFQFTSIVFGKLPDIASVPVFVTRGWLILLTYSAVSWTRS